MSGAARSRFTASAAANSPRLRVVDAAAAPGPLGRVRVSLLEEHLDWTRRCGRSPRTIRCRRMALERLAEWLGADPATVTAARLDEWQAKALPSLTAVRWHTALIRPYFKWLQARGERPDNPAALLPTPRQKRGLPRPIAEDRLEAAIAGAPARIKPWLLLAAWCGLRASEIAGLTRESFSLDAAGQVWLRVVGKGMTVRDVPVPGWVWDLIAPGLPDSGPCWRRLQGPGPMTGKLVSKYATDYLRSCGYPDTLHALRHRAATEMLRASGGNLRVTQAFLGHADLKTLQVYTLVQPAELAAAAAAIGRPR